MSQAVRFSGAVDVLARTLAVAVVGVGGAAVDALPKCFDLLGGVLIGGGAVAELAVGVCAPEL